MTDRTDDAAPEARPDEVARILAHLSARHPYDALDPDERARLAEQCALRRVEADQIICRPGDALPGLFLIEAGRVEITDPAGAPVSVLGPGNAFGERGLLRDGRAATGARALTPATLIVLPADAFARLLRDSPAFARFYDRGAPRRGAQAAEAGDLAALRVAELMTPEPACVGPEDAVREAARIMRARGVSCLLVEDAGRLVGILTARDMTARVVAEGLGPEAPVRAAMTPDPVSMGPDEPALAALLLMAERRVGHLPVTRHGRILGILTQTDLVRWQAVSAPSMVAEIAGRDDVDAIARVVARTPRLLAQLVGAGARHQVVTRLVTDVADAAARQLLLLAEKRLGPPPVPYLWLACGSQGRREQTGVSDQDNCLILHDDARPEHDAYFSRLARFVCDGLAACGYVLCPGEMMAVNPRWRQPLATWRRYFDGWIARPDPEAQMLASVMFDLRPIGGDFSLFEGLHARTLKAARANSIFIAHMVSNALKHSVPLGMFRGLALIRSGEHRNRIDLKLNGVVPVVDLGRIYALRAEIEAVNTRERLEEARARGAVSAAGGADLLDAYDLIAETRLRHQAEQVRAGEKPDNFLDPSRLSELERSHLRDAFVVVRTMQSALGQGAATLS
ncbi:putative nucleotidyltransferase substrate binding domain-containing protein [Oceanicella actignis]|uniref:putative nucleotidyltransferase substrate binding domain-containing protein n=1 Tax=Oceanicella actignis TaxID=1189325 RepID=UPI0011E77E93|nr:putative nucleotidyltransferase substrate binding domain-containing protein [Oceanicella actignis]TYO84642.1 CBS domain-containing protein [Oceanicella actignis]